MAYIYVIASASGRSANGRKATIMSTTLRNDFHGTEVTLRAEPGQVLSLGQAARARRTLCGIAGCTCGNDLGMRGPNPEIGYEGYTRDGKMMYRVMPTSEA